MEPAANSDETDFLACVGDNCIDRFGPPLNLRLVGGNALNVAVQLSQLGRSVTYFGAVGADDDGAFVARALRENGVNLAGLVTSSSPTAFTEVHVDEIGERTIGLEEFGACQTYYPRPTDIETLLRARHCHIGWLNDGGRLVDLLVSAGVCVSRDISINADKGSLSVAGLSIAFASVEGSRNAAVAVARRLLDEGAKLAVVTRGESGSLAMSSTELAEAGILPVSVVDTTGAGDSFIAGFIAARTRGMNLPSSLQFAAGVAAKTCTHIGGFLQQERPLTFVKTRWGK